MNKVEITLKKMIKPLKKILEENPNFTGDINISLHHGVLTDIDKREKIKIE